MTRSRRTPALLTGRVDNNEPSWSLSSDEWVALGHVYITPFKRAMLAAKARKTFLIAQTVEGLSDKKKAEANANRAALALQKMDAGADLDAEADIGERLQFEITNITHKFIRASMFEIATPPARPAAAWLSRIAESALMFSDAVNEPLDGRAKSMVRADLERHLEKITNQAPLENSIKLKAIKKQASELVLAVEELLGGASLPIQCEELKRHLHTIVLETEHRMARKNWKTDPGEPDMRLRQLGAHVRDVGYAAKFAAADIETEPTIHTGDAWDEWIVRLSELLLSHGMTVGAKNDVLGDGSLSPFVEFIFALEAHLLAVPGVKVRGRHVGHETGAGLGLATAINGARKRSKNTQNS